MLSIIYAIGCIASVGLTCCDMKRKIKPQDHIIGSVAMLTVIKRCILSWVGVVIVLSSLDWTEIETWKFRK